MGLIAPIVGPLGPYSSARWLAPRWNKLSILDDLHVKVTFLAEEVMLRPIVW